MAKLYHINRMDLGKRIIGHKLFNAETKEIIGLTEKQIKDLLNSGDKVYGFVLDTEGSLLLDKEGFGTTNVMIETGISNLRPLELSGAAANVFFVVVAVYKSKDGTTYETVNSRYGRTTIAESKLRALLEIGCISGGVYLDSKGKIMACEGVEIVEEVQ